MDNGLVDEIAKIERDLMQMKTSQPIGSNSVRVYETLTNFVWDYDYTMTSADYNGIGYGRGMRVIFTAREQSAPFATIRIMAEVNGQKYNMLWAPNGPSTGPANAYIQVYEDITSTGSLLDYTKDNTVRWRILPNCTTLGTTIRIKFIVTATDQGRLDFVMEGGVGS